MSIKINEVKLMTTSVIHTFSIDLLVACFTSGLMQQWCFVQLVAYILVQFIEIMSLNTVKNHVFISLARILVAVMAEGRHND